ncbi:MAG TPA: S41 family peptidase [Candidatus Saccharimonadales bacterium]|nr:S41 family peptidase [Candidatus Saccharimonadales bacterium]
MQQKGKKLRVPRFVSTLKNTKVGVGTLVVVVLLVAFGGFIAGTRSSEIAAFIGLKQRTEVIDFSSLQNVYEALSSQFDGNIDKQALIDGAKKGLVEAAGDPYTVFFTDKEASEFLQELDGRFSGIGAELGKKDDFITIVSTLDESPALRSGLQPGDFIVKVNDQDTTGWSIEKAVSQIRGEKGTTVKLTVLRDQQVKDFSIVREEIVNPSVKYEITPDNIGYLRISRFSDSDTFRLATKAAKEFKEAGVKGVVLDLRGNGGGYLGAAQDISGLWLKDKVVVEERTGDKIVETLKTDGSAILSGVPTVVLIDGGSASASEIVAGALNDYDAAVLLGTKTFGKGSVQTIEPIDGGGQLKVTVAKWYTPNGRNINKEGIEPDVVVEAGEDLTNDAQKSAAFEKLR